MSYQFSEFTPTLNEIKQREHATKENFFGVENNRPLHPF